MFKGNASGILWTRQSVVMTLASRYKLGKA